MPGYAVSGEASRIEEERDNAEITPGWGRVWEVEGEARWEYLSLFVSFQCMILRPPLLKRRSSALGLVPFGVFPAVLDAYIVHPLFSRDANFNP